MPNKGMLQEAECGRHIQKPAHDRSGCQLSHLGRKAYMSRNDQPPQLMRCYVQSVSVDRWEGVRELLKRSATAIAMPMQGQKVRRLAVSDRPIRLHLGCGTVYKPGWVNVDVARPGQTLVARARFGTDAGHHRLSQTDLIWDLRRGIPFQDGTVTAIFTEHLLEHLSFGAGLALLGNCYRALQRGSILRIGVPDLERLVRSYLNQDRLIDECYPGRPTRAVALNEPFYRFGHQAMYDFETLSLACRDAGFSSVDRSSFGHGRLGAEVDTQARRLETLYVEAIK